MKRYKLTDAEKQAKADQRQLKTQQRRERIKNERLLKRADEMAEKFINIIKEERAKPSSDLERVVKFQIPKNIKKVNRIIYATQIFKSISNMEDNKENFLWLKTGEFEEVPINTQNKGFIFQRLKGEVLELNEFNRKSGEQVEIVIGKIDTENIPLEIVIRKQIHKNTIIKGAFFPYYNKTALNLSKYQITDGLTQKLTEEDVDLYNKKHANLPNFKPITSLKVLELITISKNILNKNCLLYAFKLLGMEDNDIFRASAFVNNQNIANKHLEELATSININLIIYRLTPNPNGLGDRIKMFHYGNKEGKTYDIALHSNHYFIYDYKTSYTSYFIKNYDTLKNEFNGKNIRGLQADKINFKRCNQANKADSKYYISSLHLIDELVKNKDKYLIEITKQTINEYDETYSPYNIKDDLINADLSYDKEGTTNTPIMINERKDKYTNYDFIVVDFETFTDDDKIHIPFILNGGYLDFKTNTIKDEFSFIIDKDKTNLIERFFQSIRNNSVLIFHNSKYDFNFVVPFLSNCSETMNEGSFIKFKGTYGKYNIVIKCSYKIITEPLKKFPEMFKLDNKQKELIPYNFYNKSSVIKRFNPLKDFIKSFNKSDKEIVKSNCLKWNCINENGDVDIIEYSNKYCMEDVDILGKGYLIFRRWVLDYFQEDINEYLTAPSLSERILLKAGVFEECFQLSGIPREFIAKCMIGGRCMLSNNTPSIHSNTKINDMDAVSLYPTAMNRLDGFVKGQPNIISPDELNMDFLNSTNYYYIAIKVLKINKKLDFPLVRVEQNDKRTFTNDAENEIIYIGKTALEDAIKYHNIEFEIIKGYYFNEGFNDKIKETMAGLFTKRIKLKQEGNPAETIFKLLMNASYGKLLQKAPKNKSVLIDDKFRTNTKGEMVNDKDIYLSRNHSTIKSISYVSKPDLNNTKYKGYTNKTRIELTTPQSTHYNKIHLGNQILEMTKRIMTEPMALAQSLNIPIYYQDTDSMILQDDDISRLEEAYFKEYNRKLIGNDMGQFNSDLKPQLKINNIKENINGVVTERPRKIMEIYATDAVFVGKKAYNLKLEVICEEGLKHDAGFHTRLKGVNTASLSHLLKQIHTGKCKGKDKDIHKTIHNIYEDFYNGDAYDLDLTAGGDSVSMDINIKTNTIKNRQEFIRTIRFNKGATNSLSNI